MWGAYNKVGQATRRASERGAALVDYVILLATIALLITGSLAFTSSKVDQRFACVAQTIGGGTDLLSSDGSSFSGNPCEVPAD